MCIRDRYCAPPIPNGGSQPSFNANKITNINPNQKLGIDAPTNEIIRINLSAIESCLIAAHIPKGTPTTTPIITVPIAIINVLGNLVSKSDITDVL